MIESFTSESVENVGDADHFVEPILNRGIVTPPPLWSAMPKGRGHVNYAVLR